MFEKSKIKMIKPYLKRLPEDQLDELYSIVLEEINRRNLYIDHQKIIKNNMKVE